MKIRRLLIVANVALAAALAIQAITHFNSTPRMYAIASWKDRPTSLEATIELSESVVTGKVVKIRKAAPITLKAPGEPGNMDRIPVEVVTIELMDDDIKGKRKKGQTLELFHTGHSDSVLAADEKKPRGRPPEKPEDAIEEKDAVQSDEPEMSVVFSGLMNDPGYAVGEEYELILREGPTLKVGGRDVKTLGIVSPEGRYRIQKDKTLQPMSQREFAEELHGKPAKELRDRAAKAVGRGRGKPD